MQNICALKESCLYHGLFQSNKELMLTYHLSLSINDTWVGILQLCIYWEKKKKQQTKKRKYSLMMELLQKSNDTFDLYILKK